MHFVMNFEHCIIDLAIEKQGKSEGFDSCDRPSNLSQIGSKSLTFWLVWHWNLTNDIGKKIEHLFSATLSYVRQFVAICGFKLQL